MDYTNSHASYSMHSDDDSYTIGSSHYEPSISERSRQSEKILENQQIKDGNRSSMFTIKRRVKGKTKTINLFNTSNMLNTQIINAVTGFVFTDDNMIPYRVGTMNEVLFFKVRILNGECGIPAVTLFYDTPEQYEKHLNETLSPETKSAYIERRNKHMVQMRMKEMRKKPVSAVVIH
jgi:hypothetical protein